MRTTCRVGLLGLLGLVAAGCAAPRTPAPPPPDPHARIAAYVATFRRAEPVLLGTIARADARFRGRFAKNAKPTVFVDPFMFDQRAKLLEHVWLEAERCSLPLDLLEVEEGPLAEHALEQELLFRAINEELVRLDHEHNRRATADLVRALGASWPDFRDANAQRAADSIVAWRIGQVRFALGPYGLSTMEREDLVDALDEIEQVALRAPAPHTEREVKALRDELGKAMVLPFESAAWPDLVPLLEAFLGLFTPEAKARRAYEDARAALRAQIDVAFSVLGAESAENVRKVAAERVARAPECDARPSQNGMRRLAPPPERAWVCAAVQIAASGGSDVDEITSLVVLHDLATVGLWAMDLHGEQRDPAHARAAHPLAARLDEARVERLVRDASTHPVGPIGAATAVAMLVVDGPARIGAHARAWADFGDAPLDVVGRKVFGGRFARKAQGRASAQQRNPVE